MKIVMVINRELPLGLIANTAAVLGISLGKMFQGDIVGCDIQDADGNVHAGITTKTIPLLTGTKEQIKGMRDIMADDNYSDVTVIDFSEIAQKCRDYESYVDILSSCRTSQLYYLGICLYGPVKKVSKLTGSLSLLR
ncbi:MAG TPA: DUF2000 domain-containing protein [Sporomusaceae bacterium]|jgi:hypothetical protein|nr:hypothetical protein [Anaerospora sp.]HAK74980.1 DUF2000 domain-containing protein [Sporomusaceae bacterium]